MTKYIKYMTGFEELIMWPTQTCWNMLQYTCYNAAGSWLQNFFSHKST